jgi:hypothetical protein
MRYLAVVLVLAACGRSTDKPAPAPAPAQAPPPPMEPTPEELAAARPPAGPPPAPAAPSAEEQAAIARAEATSRQQAIEAARQKGVLGSTALMQGGAFASLTGNADFSSGFDDKDIYGGLLGNEVGEMNGGFGFGRSGFGPGGGGTGLGTIGTGRYGTLGHGSGTGSGYGVGSGRGGLRGRRAAMPQVRIGQPTVGPGLDPAIVRRYIKRNIQKITYCYEKVLLAKYGLAGTLTVEFTIGASGVVAAASASGVDTEVADCVARVIRGIEFPKPTGGASLDVTYPLTFRPDGG